MNEQPSSAERDALQEALKHYYRNLAQLESQKAMYGGQLNAPLHLLNQYEDTKKCISSIEDWLKGLSNDPPLMTIYFRYGFQAYVKGDYWKAKQYFEMTLGEYPHYPRAEELLTEAKRLISFREPQELTTIEILESKRNWMKILATAIVMLVAIAIIMILLFWLLG